MRKRTAPAMATGGGKKKEENFDKELVFFAVGSILK
nr:MAG TPA: hypothetical protein [Caudoviricetes sp.]